MRRASGFIPLITCFCAVVLYLNMLPIAMVERPRYEQLFTLPTNVLKIVSPQFKEVAADFAFLNALTYLGEARPQSDTHRYLPQQYDWVLSTLKNAVALDPYFIDPYNLMNSALIWDRYKLVEVNDLIAKGADIRTWDSFLPFFAGFNYYYFLDNSDKSFFYLKEASKRQGGNTFYDYLASRVAFKANKTEVAISYLEDQISQAKMIGRENTVEPLKKRLEVLKGIRQIEVALESYRKLFGKLPASVAELKTMGLLPTIPHEPSGGKYYIDSEGRVRSDKDLK
ncbi:MAG: hypothetical protein M0T70_08380 [Geobacteraceae bacterium]|nr:hypothetical protein [Geobacteraceae bacterium]